MKPLTFLCCFFILGVGYAQEKDSNGLIMTPNDWKREVFTFPLGFAQEIPLEGIEEAIFPPGWRVIDDHAFWSYAFAWQVSASKPLQKEDFKNYLSLYFDGLMDIESVKKSNPSFTNTNILLEQLEIVDNKIQYQGLVNTYDRFTTKEMITLNVTITQYYCNNTNRSVSLFLFSPKGFEHPIWDSLHNIQLNESFCSITIK